MRAVRPSRVREVEKVRAYVKRAEAEINNMRICPRVGSRYPFDGIGLATVSKAFALSKACLKLASSDLTDEAYGLSRSVVECATNLRFLTADPSLQNERSRDFVEYALAHKAYWAHYALKQFAGKTEEHEIREYARREGIIPNPKPARAHWSGKGGFVWDVMTVDHPLDGPMGLDLRKISYAVDYFQTSAFVHCSVTAMDNYYTKPSLPFSVSCSSGLHETSQSALFITLIYLHRSIAYALFGMGVPRPGRLSSLFERTLERLDPVPSRGS